MIVPNPDGGEICGFFEVDLHPLKAVHELYEVTFARLLVAISDVGEFADNGKVVTRGHGLVRRQ